MGFILWVIKILFYGAAAYFMYTDAKNRDTNGVLWVLAAIILCFFVSTHQWLIFPVFIILYLLLRPKGELIYCPECFKKKLIDKPYCPHCFHIDETVLDEEFEKDDDTGNDDISEKEDDTPEKTEQENDNAESNGSEYEIKQDTQEQNDVADKEDDDTEKKDDDGSDKNDENKANSLA